MAEPTVDRDPVELLAAEFMDRLRGGEYPSIEDYAAAHPECAEQIRDLFPTILAMEKLKSDKESLSGGRASLGPVLLERLGDLRIVREIGRGGMGIVYEAEQESLGRRVAVKVLAKQALLDDKHLRRFRREAKTAAKLHHTNIVPILGVGEQDGYHYYVMQIIRGVGLDEVIPQLCSLVAGTATPTAKRQRQTANVSTVLRALVCGELHTLARAADSSLLGTGLQDPSGASTGSHANSLTEVTKSGKVAAANETITVTEEAVSDSAVDFTLSTPKAVAPGKLALAYWQSVARIGLQVGNALHYAHRQGTLHRDIKPANLMIDHRGTVWVADFGLAKALEQDDVSRSGDIVGTLRYMAPEQFLGEADARSDVFALGLTLYELVTLHPAYNERERKQSFIHHASSPQLLRPRRLNPEIPRDLETIILKAIAEEPGARYQTAADLSDDLQRYLEDRPLRARRASPAERLRRWARRNPAVASLSGIAALLLVAITAVSSIAYFKTNAAYGVANSALQGERDQRMKAERTSNIAWDALDKMFQRLAPNRYVSPDDFALDSGDAELSIDMRPVVSPESAALLDEMLLFYKQLTNQGDDSDEFRQRIATAHRRIGDIRQRLGQQELARDAYADAVGLYMQLDDQSRSVPSVAAELASIYNELGQVTSRIRNPEDPRLSWDQARRAHDAAQEILEPLAAKADAPEVAYELARTYYLQASRYGFGGRSGGLSGKGSGPSRGKGGATGRRNESSGRGQTFSRERDNLAQAIQMLEELTGKYEVPDYHQLLALCYAEQYKHLRDDDRQRGEAAIAKAIETLKGLAEQYPRNPDYRLALSKVYVAGLRDSSLTREDLPAVELQAETALGLLRGLQREHPNVPEYWLTQRHLFHGLAELNVRLADYERAATYCDDARRLAERVLANDGNVSDSMKRYLSFSRYKFGFEVARTLIEADRRGIERTVTANWLEMARDQLVAAAREWEALGPDNPTVTWGLVQTYESLAAVHAALGEEEAADAVLQKKEMVQKTEREVRPEHRRADRHRWDRSGERPEREPEPAKAAASESSEL